MFDCKAILWNFRAILALVMGIILFGGINAHMITVNGGEKSEITMQNPCNPGSPEYFNLRAKSMVSSDFITQEVDRALSRARQELPSVAALSSKTGSKVIAKRLQILYKLQDYVVSCRNKNDADWLLFAWQGAEEIMQMLDYFKLEAKRINRPYVAQIILNVKNFGAKGDGKTDDTPAFRNAFEKAKTTKQPVKIIIPKGDYLLEPEEIDYSREIEFTSYRYGYGMPLKAKMWGNPLPHLQLIGSSRLTFEGEDGATIFFSDPTRMGILVVGADEMIFRNLVLNYRDRCFTQGTAIALDSKNETLDIKIDEGYPSPLLKQFTDAPTPRITPHIGDNKRYISPTCVIDKTAKVDDNIYRFTSLKTRRENINKPWGIIQPGMRVSIIARYCTRRTSPALGFRFSRFCSVENFQILGSPAHAMLGRTSYAQSLINYSVRPRDLNDLVSTNGDAYMGGATPIGPYIEGGDFSFMEDDGINVNSRCVEISKISPDGKSNAPSNEGASGVWVMDLHSGVVDAVARAINGFYMPALPQNIRSVENLNLQELTSEQKARLGVQTTRTSRFKQRPHRIIPLNGSTNGTVISNCKFTFQRGRGIQATSPNMIIDNCVFENLTGSGVTIGSLMSWGMGYAPHNVTVTNSRFVKLGYQGIWVGCSPLDPKNLIKSRPINYLFITNNTFVSDPNINIVQNLLNLSNCNNAIVDGNTFDVGQADHKAIFMDNFRCVEFNNNMFNPKPDANFSYIKFGHNANPEQLRLRSPGK